MPSVPHYRFDPTDRLTIGQVAYVCKGSTSTGHLLARVDDPALTEQFSHEAMAVLLGCGALTRDPSYFADATQLALSHAEVASLSVLSEDEQAEVIRRAEHCRRFLSLEAAWREHRALRRAIRKTGVPPAKATRSDAVMGKIIDLVNTEMRQVDYAKALSAIRTSKERQRFGFNVAFHKPISARTLRRWLTAYESALELDGATRTTALLALRPLWRKCGNHTPFYDFEAYTFIRRHAVRYATRERPSIAKCHLYMRQNLAAFNAERRARDLPEIALPSKSLLRKHIKMMDKFIVYAQRYGLEKARAKWGPIGQGPDAERPLQRVEMDGWEVHLKTLLIEAGVYEKLSQEQRDVVERVRMVLSVIIDCATRCILAMRLTPTEDEAAGVSTLAMAMTDKSALAAAAGARTPWAMCGTITSLFVDNGYASTYFRDAAIDSVIHFSVVPAALPWLRPYIERVFRTFDLQLMPIFSGRTFSNVVDAEGYDSKALASLTVDELAVAIVRFVVDVYHLTPHEGLRGETPIDAWERMTKETPPLPPPDKTKFTAVFGVERRPQLGRHGLTALGVVYQSDALQELFRRHGALELALKIHPDDAAFAVVKIGESWRRVSPTEEGFEGVSVVDCEAAQRLRRKRNADKAKTRETTMLDALRELGALGGKARNRAGIGEVAHSDADLAHAETMFSSTMHVSHPTEQPLPDAAPDDLTASFGFEAKVEGESEVDDGSADAAPPNKPRRSRQPGASGTAAPPPAATKTTPELRRRLGPTKRKSPSTGDDQ